MMGMLIQVAYIAAAVLFILGLKKLSKPDTAVQGNKLSAWGMLLAILATLVDKQIVEYHWIIVGAIAGSAFGYYKAKTVEMTGMPEMVALFNGFGGIASLLVGWSAYELTAALDAFTGSTVALSVFIGGVTFTGSLIAWAKLHRVLPGAPVQFPGQKPLNLLLLIGVLLASVVFVLNPAGMATAFYVIVGISLLLGILVTIPIGGADMPVVISLLNSYSGLAACAAGFVVQNNILIVAGALVGASGIILTNIMCKAMNRSLTNVLFGGMGATAGASSDGEEQGETHPVGVEDAYLMLEAARSVIFVPGYGMAVAQAQHAVAELAQQLEDNGAEVMFGIHPVAGRMPGHMNVLLAEANVPYDQLREMDDVNPLMENQDIAIVIGANDVVNPSATELESSPIYGMPIIEVHKAKTVIVMKRSMASGFAGVQNPLFFKENTRMLFGDAKETVQGLVANFKDK